MSRMFNPPQPGEILREEVIKPLGVSVTEAAQRRLELHALTSAAIEPILLAVIGVLVLLLALGVFLPLWNMGQAAMGRGGG